MKMVVVDKPSVCPYCKGTTKPKTKQDKKINQMFQINIIEEDRTIFACEECKVNIENSFSEYNHANHKKKSFGVIDSGVQYRKLVEQFVKENCSC